MSNGDFYTTAKMAVMLGTTFADLHTAIASADAGPSFRLNGIEYFDAQAMERIRTVLNVLRSPAPRQKTAATN